MKTIQKFIIGLLVLIAFACGQKSKQINLKKTDMADKIITISAVLNCSIDTAFNHFAVNHLLIKWLTNKADVEMKEGGKYELFWTPQDTDLTNNSTYGCKVLSVDRPYYLNIEWRGNANQKSFMNNVRPLTNVTILFSQLDTTSTKITLLHTGWRQDENWEAARQYFINAWTVAFQELERIINGK